MNGRGLYRSVARYRWLMFAILVTAYFFVYFHRMSVNAVGIEMIEDVGSGSKEYLSSIYFWTYALMQIPSGLLADRVGPRKASSVFLVIATIGSFITMIADSFFALAVGKVMIAAGMAVVYVPLTKIVSLWFDKADFPQLNGVIIAVGNVGALAASAPLVYLADSIGWRGVFLVLGVITAVIAVLCIIFIRDRPDDAVADDCAVDENAAGVMRGILTVMSHGRIYWTMALAYFLIYGTIMVFQGTTSMAYFRDHVYGFALAAWFVTMIGIGKILSTVMIGRLVSRGVIHSKKTIMCFGSFAYMVVWMIIWLFAGELDNEWVWFSICTLFGFFGGFMTLSFSQVKEWFPVSLAGTAVSSMNVMLFLGASVLTTVAGIVLGGVYTLENYTVLWGVMFAASLIAFLLVLLSREKAGDDSVIGL